MNKWVIREIVKLAFNKDCNLSNEQYNELQFRFDAFGEEVFVEEDSGEVLADYYKLVGILQFMMATGEINAEQFMELSELATKLYQISVEG